jgi:hypothetical protein
VVAACWLGERRECDTELNQASCLFYPRFEYLNGGKASSVKRQRNAAIQSEASTNGMTRTKLWNPPGFCLWNPPNFE